MFLFLSHPLDPRDLAWPGEPTVKVRQCTDITDDCPFCSFISEVPNHCGTHMDAPRHFVKDGLGINELPIEYSGPGPPDASWGTKRKGKTRRP